MKKLVQKALQPLVGLPLKHIGRSGNMLVLHFGEVREVSARDGGVQTVYDWTMQIQCPWRISQETRIVIAYRDFYYSDVPLKNLDVVSKSRTNSVLETLNAEFETNAPHVATVESDDTGMFSVRMSSGYHIEAFPAESMESGKLWRISEPGAEGRSFVFPPSEE